MDQFEVTGVYKDAQKITVVLMALNRLDAMKKYSKIYSKPVYYVTKQLTFHSIRKDTEK